MPLGGLKRVNLSNLRQASGRCRIEDCPIYDGRVSTGKLATGLKIELEHIGEYTLMKIHKNLLFQPLALHLAADGEGLHLSRTRVQRDTRGAVSDEIQRSRCPWACLAYQQRSSEDIDHVIGGGN